jgi:hypothetical protein
MLALFGSPKRRKKATDALNHFSGWDGRYVRELPPTVDTAQTIALLKKAGALQNCRVISDNAHLDGLEIAIEKAIALAESASFASLVCCNPGKLAIFFDEMQQPRIRLLLMRA